MLLREEGELLGYARVLDDRHEWRIGRVLLAPAARGRGLADPLMQAALAAATGRDVVLDAQSPLAGWYETFGFAVVGEEFLDDGIPHLPMRLSRVTRRSASTASAAFLPLVAITLPPGWVAAPQR